jgi:hypothetical protein
MNVRREHDILPLSLLFVDGKKIESSGGIVARFVWS